eukprot:COSAG01_NODE_710_length_14110_cov_94.506745_9_plen_105_part_00
MADLAVLAAMWRRWQRLRRRQEGEEEEEEKANGRSQPQLLLAFHVFDATGRGFIVATDLQRVMGSMGSSAKLEAFQEMIRLADRNQDGQRLSAIDFCYMMAPTA